MWQTEDQLPEFPRITKFLDYWDKNIDGPIKEVYIYDQSQSRIRKVDRRFKINCCGKNGVKISINDKN